MLIRTYITITLVGSWGQVGIKLIGRVEGSPLPYVLVKYWCCVTLSHWLVPATKDDLDSEPLLRGRPILLSRIDYHACWVSNTILSNLQNLPDTVDGGLIVRDDVGKPTGPSDSLSYDTGAHLAHNFLPNQTRRFR